MSVCWSLVLVLGATANGQAQSGEGRLRHSPLRPAPSAAPRAEAAARAFRSPMRRLVGGTFSLGSSSEGVDKALASCAREPYGLQCKRSFFADEVPRHRQFIPSFWLDRREVTVAQYAQCVRRRSCEPRPTAPQLRESELPGHPVTRVSWFDARDYCHAIGGRLPSESEFERAAAGRRGRTYPWGWLFHRKAANHGRLGWTKTEQGDGYELVAPVGRFPAGATPEGILDLAGNVSEWVADRYLPYSRRGAETDEAPQATGPAGLRVIRGGSFQSARVWLRSAARGFAEANTRSETVGFRCAKDSLVRRTVPDK